MSFMRSLKQGISAAGLGFLLMATQGACRLHTTGSQPALRAAAPALLLESSLGPLDSRAALAHGPLVLIFYRGHW